MKKQLIQEINRQREMMGIALIVEQAEFNQGRQEFEGFITAHDSNVLTVMEEMFGVKGRVSGNPGRNVFTYLRDIQNQLGRMFKSLTFGTAKTELVDINIIQQGYAVVRDKDVKGFEKGRERDLEQICSYINSWNLKNFGRAQIVGFNTQTDRAGVNTLKIEKGKKLAGVYVFSDKYTDIQYDATPGQDAIAGTPDQRIPVAGEPYFVDLTDSFEDVKVIADAREIERVRNELSQQAGGEVVRIAIDSTATATGIGTGPQGQDLFVAQMRAAGFPQYMKITNFAKDTKTGDFSETEVTSGDRALAVVRGKYLAKQLGFDDSQVDYSFSLVPEGQPKSVTLRVVGQGEEGVDIIPGTPGTPATDASGEETFTTTETGNQAKLTRGHITLTKK